MAPQGEKSRSVESSDTLGDMLSTDMTSCIGNIVKDNLTGKLSSSVETQGQGGKGPKGNIASIMGMDLINNLGNIGQENLTRASGTASDDKSQEAQGEEAVTTCQRWSVWTWLAGWITKGFVVS